MIFEETIKFIIDPIFIIILLFIIYKFTKSRKFFIIFFIYLFLINIFPTNNIIQEALIKFDNWEKEEIDGFIILGGDSERILLGMKLARENPKKTVIFSGGKSIYSKSTEASDAKKYLDLANNKNIFYEDKSVNTYENALFSYRNYDPKDKLFLIITSEYHSLRAYKIFKKVGWNVKSFHKKDDNYNFFRSCCESFTGQMKKSYKLTNNFFIFNKLFNEIVALFYYKLKYNI
tara:strand:+ start:489 stop:1184 length:696 start_codon:yes stop_codon:yes gene_type:complete